MAVLPPSQFASLGTPARIIGDDGTDIHIDALVRQQRSSDFRRSSVTLENGAPLTSHRIRELQTVEWEIVISDIPPTNDAQVLGRWELDHARKTRDRLLQAQLSTSELRLFDGSAFLRTPAGITVWVIDSIPYDEQSGDLGVFRATIRFGESPRASTVFAQAPPEVATGLSDIVTSPTDRGRQSTTAAADGGEIAAGAWP